MLGRVLLLPLLVLLRHAAGQVLVNVRSAGSNDGNMTQFYVNGTLLQTNTGTGITLVVLDQYGSMQTSTVFNTNDGSGNANLVSFVNGMASGTAVLCAVQGEAAAGMTPAVLAALASLGSVNASSIRTADSWAMVGFKNGAALVELRKPSGTGAAWANATFDTINALSTVNGGVMLQAMSANMADGNAALYFLNGTQFKPTTGTGFNIVALWPNGTVRTSGSFNTYDGSGNAALVAFVNGLAMGTPVLVAVQDEAYTMMTPAVVAALISLGATTLPTKSRDSYALIGFKYGTALAELRRPTTTGPAWVAATLVPGSFTPITNWPPVNIQIQSAGFSSGNTAQFLLNGSPLSWTRSSSTGFHVIVLWPDGTVRTSGVFDTHSSTAGATAMATFLNGVPTGTPVLCAIRDEGFANLAPAVTALTSLGATLVSSIGLQDSYALIGIKGGMAVAEQLMAASTKAPAWANGTYVPGAFLQSQSGPPVFLQVRSASFADGNLAQFWIGANNQLTTTQVSTGTGMNVVTLNSDGTFRSGQCYNTNTGGNSVFSPQALANYLNGLAVGTPVMIAVQDEGGSNLTQAAKTAIMGFGAQNITNIAFRDSYGLIGIKGSTRALAERRLSTGRGMVSINATYRPPPVPKITTPLNIQVTSGGFIDGSASTFTVNGTAVNFPTMNRGLNVVILTPAGAVLSTTNYPIFQGLTVINSFVSSIASLSVGTPVLIAVKDDATDNSTAAVQAAIRQLGALQIQSLGYRASYALIGIMGGTALAEQLKQTGGGIVSISATYQAPVPVVVTTVPTTTTVTTTLAPSCRQYTCKNGTMLKLNAASLLGASNDAFCCDPPLAKTMSLVVRSGCFDDGNFVDFVVNGARLGVNDQRGINVVVLRNDSTLQAFKVFDTYDATQGGSAKLANFLNGLEAGTLVMMGAMDEASASLNTTAEAAMAACGAKLAPNIGFRSNYAFIGYTGSSTALAEQLTANKAGFAMAVARTAQADSTAGSLPICNATTDPPLTGFVTNEQLILDSNCRYLLWDQPAAYSCLQGTWVVLAGGSNMGLMAINFASLLAGAQVWLPVDDHISEGSYTVADLVLDGGKVMYKKDVNYKNCSDEVRDDGCQNLIQGTLSQAPAPTVTSIRITMFSATYWDHVTSSVKAVQSQQAWSKTQVALQTQVSAWYLYCSIKNQTWCTRLKQLGNVHGQEALNLFNSEMMQTVDLLKTFCPLRASVFGCMIGTNFWQDPPPGYQFQWYTAFNAAIKANVLGAGLPSLKFIDYWKLGLAMTSEIVDGHGTPLLNIWTWQVILTGWCPASLTSDASYADFQGDYCQSADLGDWNQASTKCPNYYPACQKTFRCEPWECANSVKCTLVPAVPSTTQEDLSGQTSATLLQGNLSLSLPNAASVIADPKFLTGLTNAVAQQMGNVSASWVNVTCTIATRRLADSEEDLGRSLATDTVLVSYAISVPSGAAITASAITASSASATAASFQQILTTQLVQAGSTAQPTVVSIVPLITACDPFPTPNFPVKGAADTVASGKVKPCPKLWCDTTKQWVPPVVSTIILILLTIWIRYAPMCLPKILHPRLLKCYLWLTEEPKKPAGKGKPEAKAAAPAEKPEVKAEKPKPKAEEEKTEGVMPSLAVPQEHKDEQPLTPIRSKTKEILDRLRLPIRQAGEEMPGEEDAQEEGDNSPPVSPKTPLKMDQQVIIFVDEEPAGKKPTQKEKTPKAKPTVVEMPPLLFNWGATAPAGDRFPLGLARTMASLHVVLGHMAAKGETPYIKGLSYFFGWGFTWVPWFFMLSGFVLGAAQLRRSSDENTFEYVMRRSVTIYPLYAASLVPSFIFAMVQNQCPPWYVLFLQCFLLQSWFPWITEQALQSHCWFISCMVVYWALMKPVCRFAAWLQLKGVIASILVCCFLPWLTIIIAGNNQTWYEAHNWGKTSKPVDIGVVVLKFNPVSYFHVFVMGVMLARLRTLLNIKALATENKKRWRWPFEFLCLLGYAGLTLTFLGSTITPPGYKLSARLSILLPAQGAILFGLAGLPCLPLPYISQLFAYGNFFEAYSYAIYVFQFLLWDIYPNVGLMNLWLFFLFLMTSVFIIVPLIRIPCENWWTNHPRGRLVFPFVFGGLLAGLSAIPQKTPSVNNSVTAPDLPAFVRIDSRTIDVRFPIFDLEGAGTAVINPSLALVGDNLMIAARRHRIDLNVYNGDYNGTSMVYQDHVWTSAILLGSATVNMTAWASWPTTGVAPFSSQLSAMTGLQTPQGSSWSNLCFKDSTYVPQNKTVVRNVVNGPEDPKILIWGGQTVLAFDSQPPAAADGSCSMTTLVKGVPSNAAQMYIVTGVNPAQPKQALTGVRLNFGSTTAPEKNWIPFVSQDGFLRFVYQPSPQVILSALANGTTTRVGTTSFKPMLQKLTENSKWEARGSAQAVFVNDTANTPNLPRPHYLAFTHIYDQRSGAYAHYAYRISPDPPHSILQVSQEFTQFTTAQAQMTGPAFAFVSGVVVSSGTVVISYGSGDRDARALVMTLERLDEMFCTA